MSATTVHVGSEQVVLRDEDLLGVGGEGRVYRHRDLALKVFFQPSAARAAKLQAFPRDLPTRVVAPVALCTDRRGAVVGYAMKALDQAVDLHRVGTRKWRTATRMSANDVLATFRELASLVVALHARGIVVGDLNDGNVVVTANASATRWSPWLIDADSIQLPGHACVVAHERFLDPNLYGTDLTATPALSRATDWYAFAVLLFTSLLYVHPYGGAHPAYPTLLRRAEARHSVLRGDVTLAKSALSPDVLPDELGSWLMRVFENDARTPVPTQALEACFTACACGVEHARRTCPACTVQVSLPAPVVVRGSLRVTRSPIAPPAEPERVRLEGEWLVRVEGGTRIGKVLEGRTHVRTSEHLGFAFYRASALTVHFTFDVQRGALRQVTLPPIEGRLVDFSVAFDREHVLFATQTEKDGRVLLSAHLLTASGELLASESGPPGSSAALHSVAGMCIAGGLVLAATPDGLVLLRADRGTKRFLPHRAFPETRDLVPLDAELLVGPRGSVYAVSYGETVHLCFEGNPSS